MQFLSEFLNIVKIPNFYWKNVDISRTRKICHVIYTFFGSYLGEVQLRQVSFLWDMYNRSISEQPRKDPS